MTLSSKGMWRKILADPNIDIEAGLPIDGTVPRFFHDHGVVHDRLTGKHVCTAEHPDTSLDEIVALLNTLARPKPIAKGVADEKAWLVWNTTDCLWWKADRAGYTRIIGEAGRYTLPEAIACATSRSQDLAYPTEVVMPSPELSKTLTGDSGIRHEPRERIE